MHRLAWIALAGSLGLPAGSARATQLLDPPASGKPTSITVFVARKIVTMDPSLPVATAVAVADGKILSVGSFDDLKPWTGKYPTRVDRRFADKVIYPGFVEAHAHPLMGGILYGLPLLTPRPAPNPWGKPFPGVPTLEAALAQLQRYSASIEDPAKPLLAWGYDERVMGATLDRKLLDRVSPTRPLAVWDDSGHNMFVNEGLIQAYGITPEKVKGIPGVGIDEDGRLNGQFREIAATQYVLGLLGKEVLGAAALSRGILYGNDLLQQRGITTSGDMALGALDLEMELEAARTFTSSEATSLRIVEVAFGDAFVKRYGDQAPARAAELAKSGTDRLIFQGVKFYSDDGYLPETMDLRSPGYTDGHPGSSNFKSAGDFAAHMKPWWDAGFHIHVHSNGDGGNQDSLNALQLLQDARPRLDHRFTLEHFGIPTTAMVLKAKALGAVVSANITYVSGRAGVEHPGLGTDRASYATRVGLLMRSGVVTSIHSDFPAGPVSDPLAEVWAAVTRQGLDSGQRRWAPAEALPVAEAMKMVTLHAAYTLGVEDKVGTIEAGKYADFVVLGDDPQTVPAARIKDVPVVATVLGGRVVPVSETRHPRPLK
jgi:predicted amidohydrolase YtcJ